MTGAPLLMTERFGLWRPQRDDLAGLCCLLADEETRRYLGQTSADEKAQWERLMRNAGSWALYGYGNFLVRPHGSDEIVATCGVFHSWRGFGAEVGFDNVPEAGWIVRRDHWRQGVALEAMNTVMAWFDETIGRRRVVCLIEDGNEASQRVAARLGFAFYRDHEAIDMGERYTLKLYERVPSEI